MLALMKLSLYIRHESNGDEQVKYALITGWLTFVFLLALVLLAQALRKYWQNHMTL
jgi:hypothetical protein